VDAAAESDERSGDRYGDRHGEYGSEGEEGWSGDSDYVDLSGAPRY
jgi:hypothetical protein